MNKNISIGRWLWFTPTCWAWMDAVFTLVSRSPGSANIVVHVWWGVYCNILPIVARANTGPATRPAPLSGVNVTPVNTQARLADNPARPENVNQVADMAINPNNNNAGPSRQNQYREPHQSYMVFVTAPSQDLHHHQRTASCTDRKSVV